MHTTGFTGRSNCLTRKHVIENNEQARKKRYILERVICCVKFCRAFALEIRWHRNNEESENHPILRELFNFFAELDVVLREHLPVKRYIRKQLECEEDIYDKIKISDFFTIKMLQNGVQ